VQMNPLLAEAVKPLFLNVLTSLDVPNADKILNFQQAAPPMMAQPPQAVGSPQDPMAAPATPQAAPDPNQLPRTP
ncbi:MAG: hypothetical protein WCL08_00235, partial [Verrucomicrobiota bacterium]